MMFQKFEDKELNIPEDIKQSVKDIKVTDNYIAVIKNNLNLTI